MARQILEIIELGHAEDLIEVVHDDPNIEITEPPKNFCPIAIYIIEPIDQEASSTTPGDDFETVIARYSLPEEIITRDRLSIVHYSSSTVFSKAFIDIKKQFRNYN
jgi:hypothetical protein